MIFKKKCYLQTHPKRQSVLEISGYLCLMGIEIFKIEEEEEMKPNSWLATPLEK